MVTAQPNLSSALATQRIYYLSVQTRAEGFADSLELLGAFSPEPRTLEQVQRSLKKARSGEYEILMLSPSLFSHPRRKEIVDLCRQSEMQVVLQFTPEQTELVKELLSGNTSDLSCQLVITHQAESILELNLPPPVFLSLALILVTRSLDVFSAVDQVIKRGLDPFIYFPYERQNLEFYSVKEIHQLISHLKLQFPSVNLRHHRGLDVYEPEIDPLRQNEPLIEPQISYRSSNPDIQISVIIPSYNNVKYLSATVRHLLYQTLSDDQFEIIIVDDGSNDGTMEVIRAQVDKCPRKLNFKYIYFPRPQSRQMGDSQFRAGIARNLGVKHAEGQWLAFLDSDILVSPNYLRRLLEQHRHFDVIQGKRLELTAKASSAMTEYQQIDPARDTYAVDHGYWLKFYENATVWNSVPAGWKYTCTHSLSLPTKLFKKVGWFRKTFIRYGFEDTDLGWRLWSDGARFKLNDEFVFHLYHATERSEFRNSHRDKMALLSKSAPTLYLNSLNPEVYREFEYLFNDSWDHRIYLKKKRANLPQPKSRQPGPPIELFFSPLGKKCDHQCHYCDSLSFKGLKTKNSLEPKAVPCNFLSLEQDVSLRESQNFPDIFVNCRDLADRGKLIKLERLASLQRIWLILDGYAERNLRQLIELLRHPNVSAIAIVYKKFDVFRILGNVDSCFHNKIYYHFPEHSHSKDSFLSCDEIFRFKNEIQRRFPWHDIRLIHFKQMSDKSLEFPRVKWEAPFSSESKRSLSLVVTNRNQGEFFKTALESWLRQSSELRPLVEIVVVNFERGENFIDELKEMLANFPDRSPNLTYLDLSQQASSVMSFAMKKEVARIARGRRILFVDSHLLPSPDFLKENVLRTDKKNEVFHFVQPYQSLPIEERRPCPWYERQLCSFLINREAFLSLPFDSSGYISAFFARIDFSYQLYCHQFLVVESEWKGTSSARLGYEDLSQGQSINNQPGAITDAKRFYCRYLDEKIYDRFFLLMGENHFLRLFVWWSFSQIKKSTMAVVLKWAAVGGEKVFAVIKSVLKWVEYYFLTSYGLRIVGIKLGVVLIKLRVLVIKAKYFILEGYHLGRRLYGWYLSSPRTYPLRKVYYFTRYQVIKWRQRLFVGAQLDD